MGSSLGELQQLTGSRQRPCDVGGLTWQLVPAGSWCLTAPSQGICWNLQAAQASASQRQRLWGGCSSFHVLSFCFQCSIFRHAAPGPIIRKQVIVGRHVGPATITTATNVPLPPRQDTGWSKSCRRPQSDLNMGVPSTSNCIGT